MCRLPPSAQEEDHNKKVLLPQKHKEQEGKKPRRKRRKTRHPPTDRCLRADFPMRPFHHTTTKIGREKNPSFSDPLSPPVARRRERGRERSGFGGGRRSLHSPVSTVRPLKCFSPRPAIEGGGGGGGPLRALNTLFVCSFDECALGEKGA